MFIGAASATLLWAIGSIVGWQRVGYLADREQRREIGVTDAGYYFFNGESSTRCTKTNANGDFVFGASETLCEFNTPGFRSALLSVESALVIVAIVLFILSAIYLGMGIAMFKKVGTSKKREAEI